MLQPRLSPRHGPVAQLLITWSPLSLILVAYAVAGWVSAPLDADGGGDANRLGFGLHLSGPAEVDRAWFGQVPTVWLQARLVDGAPHWYDAVAALVYVTHFVSLPLVTTLVWFRLRERFGSWMLAVIAFTALGICGYLVYPAAPPWLAAAQGRVGAVERISALGWDYLHLPAVADLTTAGQELSNPVAAMPSLHAGAALLVTLFLWPVATRRWRVALATYVVAMGLTLVYTGEHYVVDVVTGWSVAAMAVAICVGARRLPRLQRVPRLRQRRPVAADLDDPDEVGALT